jgi:zinc transport system permease protein
MIMSMLEPFFIKAIVAGIGVAIMCGTLGCFVAWQRLAYFGDTIAHAALLGVVLSLMMDSSMDFGIIAVSLGLAASVAYFERHKQLASDTLLGIAAHGALAISLVLLSFSSITVDIGGYLFGDILAVNWNDIALIYVVTAAILFAVKHLWRDLMRVTLHADIAKVEGVNVARTKLFLMLLIALAVAVSIKIVGMLLITALLIIPAAIARYFSATPLDMIKFSTIAGVVAVTVGLGGSLTWDTPSGPSIIVAALVVFLVAHIYKTSSPRMRGSRAK